MRRAVFILTGLWMVLAIPVHAANQLSNAPSPYLRLHATDPVHWRTWSDDVFEQARTSAKPVLLSIGYLACHWCHVMQKESYANPDVAAFINAHFIPVIVDREARPDIDAYYQHAMANMGAATGWPLTVFLTPDRAPFWGGGYFPEPARGGMPSFSDILRAASDAYREDPGAVMRSARAAVEQLRALAQNQPGELTVQKAIDAGADLADRLDPLQGGFGEGAKFPNVPALDLIWRTAIATSNTEQMGAVIQTLRHMVNGGLYDHVGGGFFRYTIDPAWAVPHFEKMLDTNAAMLGLMVEVWRETRDPLLEQRIRETLAFMLKELLMPDGVFAAALDASSLTADNHLEEGAFYTWDPDEVRKLAGEDADAFFQDFTIIALPDGPADGPGTLQRIDFEAGPLSEASLRVLDTLKIQRSNRSRPRRDNKVLVDWNSMAVQALAETAAAFNDPSLFDIALTAYDGVLDAMVTPDGVWRGRFNGEPIGPSLIEDHAVTMDAALTLYEIRPLERLIRSAVDGLPLALAFEDEAKGGFYHTRPDQDAPTQAQDRLKPRFDEPNPSANALMARVLAKLDYYRHRLQLRQKAQHTMNAFGGLADDPGAYRPAAALLSVPLVMDDAVQVVIMADDPISEGADALRQTVLGTALGARLLLTMKPNDVLPDGHPAQYKEQIDGEPTVYVCRGTVCSLPVTTPADLRRTLLSMRGADFITAPINRLQ